MLLLELAGADIFGRTGVCVGMVLLRAIKGRLYKALKLKKEYCILRYSLYSVLGLSTTLSDLQVYEYPAIRFGKTNSILIREIIDLS